MYVDDIAPIADTSVEPQRKLKALQSFCQKRGMEMNLAKTKIIVFRNGGKLSLKRKVFIQWEDNSYSYAL